MSTPGRRMFIREIVFKDESLQEQWKLVKEKDFDFLKEGHRNEFHIPKDSVTEEELVYVCGNSLGPQPKNFNEIILSESDTWAKQYRFDIQKSKLMQKLKPFSAVNGHLSHPNGINWVEWDSIVLDDFKRIIGAKDTSEVALNSSLTSNLHNLLIHFYQPTPERFKIITDGMSFPTDYYALESQIKLHGFDPKYALIEINPIEECLIIDEEDILNTIREHGNSVALIMFSSVHYLTGQRFNMKAISQVGKEVGATVSFDLAHAIGNVPIDIEHCDADFAVWCTYKYLNSGPGSVGGYYVNRKHHLKISNGPLLAGWWGVESKNRFLMKHQFEPYIGARAFQQSCTSIFNACGVIASMKIMKGVHIENVRERSFALTEYFRNLFVAEHLNDSMTIITPREKDKSGAQLSITFRDRDITIKAFEDLTALGIVLDRREPNIIRITFTGLYNSYEDVFLTIQSLKLIK